MAELANNDAASGYIHTPTICGNKIAFIAEDDLWMVDREGGHARRLTNQGTPRRPLFSPNGEFIAFSMASDLWVMTVADTRYRRLTYFGAGELKPVRWKVEGDKLSVIVTSTFVDPFDRFSLYEVDVNGGEPKLLYGGVEYDTIMYEPDGKGVCLGRKTSDLVAGCLWKGYRGGQHGWLWLDAKGDSKFERIKIEDPNQGAGSDLNISNPMWIKMSDGSSRLFFVSDHDGSGNLWSVDLSGGSLKKHTSHNLFDARNPQPNCQGDEMGIAYTHAGELWLLGAGEGPKRVPLIFGAPTTQLPKYLEACDWIEDVTLHPDGNVVACLCRGQVFEMALWEGPAIRMTNKNTPTLSPAMTNGNSKGGQAPGRKRAVRCTGMEYLFSGRLLTITDENSPLPTFTLHPEPCLPEKQEQPEAANEWMSMLMADIGQSAQTMTLDKPIGQVDDIVASPTHDAAVLVTARCELLLLEFAIEGGKKPNPQTDPFVKMDTNLQAHCKKLDHSEFEWGISEPCWSPDGEWIAYSRKDSHRGASIILLELSTGNKTVVADSVFENSSPCFDRSGKYLTFISSRIFAPLEDDVTTDMSFASASMPYLILLREAARNPFRRLPVSPSDFQDILEDGVPSDDDDDDSKSSGSESGDEWEPPKKVEIDIDGIEDRIIQFPLPAGCYSSGTWTESGRYQYIRAVRKAVKPEFGGDEEVCKQSLYVFDFVRRKERRLVKDIESYNLTLDGKDMIICAEDGDDDEDQYLIAQAGHKPGSGDDSDDEDEPRGDDKEDSPGPDSGILNLDRINLEVVPEEEWAQILGDFQQHVKERLFDGDLGGVDWDSTCDRYREVLPRLRSRRDLTDLMAELLAELGVSHCFMEDPGDDDQEDRETELNGEHGHLGLQAHWLDLPGGGVYVVDAMLKGDVWDPAFSGPLARAGIGVTKGAYIIAVNRTRVCKEVSLDQMLANCNEFEVFLTYVPADEVKSYTDIQNVIASHGGVEGFRQLSTQSLRASQDGDRKKKKKKGNRKDKDKDKGNKSKSMPSRFTESAEMEKKLKAMLRQANCNVKEGPIWRTVRVFAARSTVMEHAGLRDFAEKKLAEVHSSTKGRVGYIRVPDTCEIGAAEFYRYFVRESSRDALIVDLRCNCGGYATGILLKQLRNHLIAYDVPRPGCGKPIPFPELSVTGKLVLLCDENTASDGEVWSQAFQEQGLGKVVGVRTHGGVVSIGDADIEFIDGGEATIPHSHYFVPGKTGYQLENRGAVPDIVVEWSPNCPSDVDPQLNVAIEEAMKLLADSDRFSEKEIPAFPRTRLHRGK
eukprot:TRINITY_DN16813_c0_g2_i1.p1 TRINITY_DN16813_c0_g2~~TRINITY_DN16813_c0_g2_i1.p1  ORF type:complete len:1300 (+),score=250.15 TRINITY_DN16813_c0_g2_i1:143-4042(+)